MPVWWSRASALGRTLAPLFVLTTSVACGSSDQAAPAPVPSASTESRIAEENELPGTTAYELENASENGEIEAYASAVSGVGGDSVDLRVNVSVPSRVSFELFRLGYYH